MAEAAHVSRRPRRPLAMLVLVIGLPLAIVCAGIATVVIASAHGFTPIAQGRAAPVGH